jgi:tetratricopeptide (TPR) repeat protein
MGICVPADDRPLSPAPGYPLPTRVHARETSWPLQYRLDDEGLPQAGLAGPARLSLLVWVLAVLLSPLVATARQPDAQSDDAPTSPVKPLDTGSASGQPSQPDSKSTSAAGPQATSNANGQAPVALNADLAAQMNRAEDALERRDFQAALDPLKKVTAAAPRLAEAWYYLGYAQHGLHQDGAAREAYEKAVALKPDLAEAQVNLGSLLVEARDFTGALPHLEAAVRLKPADPRAQVDLGLALDGAGQHEAAALEFRRALEINPKAEDALYQLGHVELGAKRYPEAAADLEKALALRPDDAGADRDLAEAEEALGQAPQAAEHLEAYLKVQPADSGARLHLAGIYLGLKQPGLAIAELQQVESAGATLPPKMEQSLGEAYAAAGKYADSEVHYRKALAAAGDQAEPHRALAEVLLKEGKKAEAEAEFRKALAIDPGSIDALKGLASSIYLEGRYAEAAPLMEKALRLPGASPLLYFVLASCYDHLRDRPRALVAYKEFLARANGSNPDQEWQAEQRAKLLSRELGKPL